jgi:hypothetical protein
MRVNSGSHSILTVPIIEKQIAKPDTLRKHTRIGETLHTLDRGACQSIRIHFISAFLQDGETEIFPSIRG